MGASRLYPGRYRKFQSWGRRPEPTRVQASGKWKRPLVTEIAPAGKFYPAESDHQDYLVKHPDGYTCHFLRD